KIAADAYHGLLRGAGCIRGFAQRQRGAPHGRRSVMNHQRSPSGEAVRAGAISTAEKIGFIGLGSIGAPMACRLAGAGFQVLGCDRSPELTAAAIARISGAEAATLDMI